MRLRAAGLLLALAAITFKAFLPPGFMFAEQPGHMTVVLCSESGRAMTYDLVTGETDGDHQAPASDSAGQHCPFAVACGAAFAPQLIEIAAPISAAFVTIASTPLAERPQSTPVGPPLPARGPPLQA